MPLCRKLEGLHAHIYTWTYLYMHIFMHAHIYTCTYLYMYMFTTNHDFCSVPCRTICLPDGIFSKKPNLGTFWRDLQWKMLVYVFYDYLVYFPASRYVVPRKIWRPWHATKVRINHHVLLGVVEHCATKKCCVNSHLRVFDRLRKSWTLLFWIWLLLKAVCNVLHCFV
jgi:hypothetical protein